MFAEGRIKLYSREERWIDFEDKAKGKEPYYRMYIQLDEGDVIKVGSKADQSSLVDKHCVFTFALYPDRDEPYKYVLTLVEAKASGAE